MTSTPYSPEPQQGGHPYSSPSQGQQPGVISGELVPQALADPYQRTYDPFAGQGAHAAGAVQPYAPQPYAGGAPPYGPPPVMVLPAQKSVGVAFVLTFFFGALGMFYSTVSGALILLGIALGAMVLTVILIGILAVLTLGIGAALFGLMPFILLLIGVGAWITSMIWGCMAASRHNERLAAQYESAGYRPPGY